MAEQVKQRVGAARLAVAFAAAGIIAGAAATATGAPGDSLPPNSVGTQQVRNDTLLHKDFKTGEVYSKDDVAKKFLKIDDAADKWLKIDDAAVKYLKIDEAAEKFLKIDDAANTYVKGDALNSFVKVESLAEALNSYLKLSVADSTFLKIQDAANTYVKGDALNSYVKVESLAEALNSYLKIDDANQKFVKVDGTAANSAKLGGLSADEFVRGDGSVLNGSTLVGQGSAKTLLGADRLFTVDIDNETGSPKVKITSPDTAAVGFSWGMENGQGGTVAPGQTTPAIPFDASADTQVIQILIGDVVGTLSVSVVPGQGGAQAFGQALLGD